MLDKSVIIEFNINYWKFYKVIYFYEWGVCCIFVSSNVYVYWDGKVMKGLFIIFVVDKGVFVLRFCIRKLWWCCYIEYILLKEKIRVIFKMIFL